MVEQEHGAVLDGLEVVDVSVDVLNEVVHQQYINGVHQLAGLLVHGPCQVILTQEILQRVFMKTGKRDR